MILKETKGGEKFAPIPAGIAQAVFSSVVDLGTQTEQAPDGGTKKARKVLVTWELPHETIQTEEGEKRRRISKRYTASQHKKASLRAMLEGARGKQFTDDELKAGVDLGSFLGRNCQLSIVHKEVNGKTYANIASVVPLGKGMSPVTTEGHPFQWDLPESGPIEFPVDMPEWIRNVIKESDEYKQRNGDTDTSGLGVED